MAVDIFSETSFCREMSPRISFSHDLPNCEPHLPLKSSVSDYDFDFDFCVSKRSCDQDSSMADELFANGVILPIQMKAKDIPTIPKSIISTPSSSSSLSSSSSSRVLSPPHSSAHQTICDAVSVREKQGKDNNKLFWSFKRSSSMNCGSFYSNGLCSLPLLSRSKSTGSTASAKKPLITSIDEPHINHNHKKQRSLKKSSSTNHQKPPLKKNYGGSSFNSGVIQVSPVINVTRGSLFGFCSIFSNAKDNTRKK